MGRREVVTAGGAILTGSLLPGCLGTIRGRTDSISIAATEGEGRLFRRLTDEFVTVETGIEVNVELKPYDALYEQNRKLLAEKRDEFDLVFMDDPWFPNFASDLEPIVEYLPDGVPDEYIQTTLDIAHWPTPRGPLPPEVRDEDPTLRGLVVVGNTQIFVYNAAYFNQVGYDPPETYRDVLEAGRAIDEIDGVHGYVIRGAQGNPIVTNFFPVGFSQAGSMFDTDWRFQWNSQDGIEALRFFVKELADISPADVTKYNEDEVVTTLAQGTAAQASTWPGTASLAIEDDSPATGDLAFTVIPSNGDGRRAPQQGNWIVGINSYTSEAAKKASGKVIQSFVSREGQERYVDIGGVPFRHDTFENNLDARPWMEALYESLQEARWRPRTPLWPVIEQELGLRLHSALGGPISAEEAMSSAETEIESVLKNAGYY
ncbi:extracellular solute-binding protein (plasmid) [Haloferax mediterranei ATCC 33500]|uniref:ABC transporter substrate-binding protein n=1 Tax=Haloferax mediterranei (strain ATCC 33500 / DSM 1411 / JCM 8866 / NBRC 14739 / NCIMB 2177 / R-4) TaxID=523841 RepID=A0A059TWH0_HALMT|nr:ABC transporter substrate-binding protein [Haloferax mediterranei ATCC 33500]QCQ77075.1 extracellular solute-binding protein [Haloferax mediterranei ATCC 33500]